MVRGLKLFADYFTGYEDRYVLSLAELLVISGFRRLSSRLDQQRTLISYWLSKRLTQLSSHIFGISFVKVAINVRKYLMAIVDATVLQSRSMKNSLS